MLPSREQLSLSGNSGEALISPRHIVPWMDAGGGDGMGEKMQGEGWSQSLPHPNTLVRLPPLGSAPSCLS